MTTFNESEHPRVVDGTFTSKDQSQSSSTFPGTEIDPCFPDLRPPISHAADGNTPWTGVSVTAEHGVTFNVRLVEPGESYGATNSLVADSGALVEFYDTRHPHTDRGQFVTRYNLTTILGDDKWGSGSGGINLHGGVDAWEIDAGSMDQVRDWLRSLDEDDDERIQGLEAGFERDMELRLASPASDRNYWGTLKSDVGEGFCPDCECEGGRHYESCPTRTG